MIARRRTLPALSAALVLVASGATALLVAPSAHAAGTANIQITEFAYGGLASYAGDSGDGEYIELTNTGAAAQDLTGWHYNTTDSVTGAVDLSSLGTVAPGESAVITDLTPADFRTEWGLRSSVKVVNDGSVTLNKGPKTIYVLDGSNAVADQLTYDTGYLAGKGIAAWVNPGHLADTDTATAGAWTNPATPADAEGSWTSAGGANGSPGASTQGTSTPGSVRTAGVSVSGGVDQAATVDTAFSFTGLSVAGGTAPYTWSAPALSGTGLSIDPATGAITGTPASLGAIDVTVTVTDSAGAAGSASFTITVTKAADPGWADVVINEITADNEDNPQLTDSLPPALLTALSTAGDARDLVELYNKGDQAVDITGWKQTDSGDAGSATDFSGRVFDVDGKAITSIPAHGFGVFQSGAGLGSGGDAVKIYLPDGTPVDSVSYGAAQAGYDESIDPDGAGPDATEIYHTLARCPADGAGAVNTNSNDPQTSWYSVKAVSIGWSNDASCDTSTDPTAAVTYYNEQPPTGLPGACAPSAPSGSDAITVPDARAWPTRDGVKTVDDPCEFTTAQDPAGNDMSGLVFSGDGKVLWAAQNKSHLWKLVKDPATGTYLPATDDDWGNGKNITFAGTDPAVSQPDDEGLTVGGNGDLFVTSERDNDNSDVSKDEVLEYDPTAGGSTLAPVRQWDLTSDFVPSVIAAGGDDANLGFEGVTYVPDSFLTAHGFRDQHKNKTYNPAGYPLHGSGLYLLGVEKTGHVYAYALNSDGTYQRIADIDTGIDGTSAIADLQFNADDQGVWTLCDNDCGVAESLLRVNADGDFTRVASYDRPAGLPDTNLEGFAIAPASTAVDGKREVLWSDDGIYGDGNAWNSDHTGNTPSPGWGHALYSSTIPLDAVPSCGNTLTTHVPTIQGSTKVGSKLTATVTPWGPAPVTLTYQWYADGAAIKGATSPDFHATGNYLHTTLTVVVTGTKNGYITASVSSPGFTIVNGAGK